MAYPYTPVNYGYTSAMYAQPVPQNVAVYEEYYQIFRDTFPLFSRNLQKLTNLGRNA